MYLRLLILSAHALTDRTKLFKQEHKPSFEPQLQNAGHCTASIKQHFPITSMYSKILGREKSHSATLRKEIKLPDIC